MFNEHKEDSTPRLPKTRLREDEHKLSQPVIRLWNDDHHVSA